MLDHVIIEIHGIRQKKTAKSWPFRHEIYSRQNLADPSKVFFRNEVYEAGLIPMWNHRVINPKQSASLLWKIVMLREAFGPFKLDFIMHSNGNNVGVSTMEGLVPYGIRTHRAIMIGAAVHSDIRKNGVLELTEQGYLKQAIAYCSEDDGVVKHLDGIPGLYGALGAKGFHSGGKPFGTRTEDQSARIVTPIATRIFPEYEHSEYFDPDHIEDTFELINRDLRLN